jgi:hypothetical protein
MYTTQWKNIHVWIEWGIVQISYLHMKSTWYWKSDMLMNYELFSESK